MEFPTTEAILDLHDFVIERTGGTRGVLDRDAVAGALARCQWGPFPGAPDLALRAALLLRGICQDHPFVDGNKRSALAAAAVFVSLNGHELDVDRLSGRNFMLRVATDRVTPKGIARWLRRRLRKGEE